MSADQDDEARELFRRELRRGMATTRAALPKEARAARAERAAERLLAFVAERAIDQVVAYVAARGELDPAPSLARFAAHGLPIALPRVRDVAGGMTFHLDCGPRVAGAFGLSEPPADAPPVVLGPGTLVLVPALAVDTRGNRLGQGRGFYDRALAGAPGFHVAFVHDFQLVAELLPEAHDVPVHAIVTDARALHCRS